MFPRQKSDSDSLYNNANIDWLNGVVESLCDQKQTYYIDVNEIFDDGAGNLDAQYTSDDAHPLGKILCPVGRMDSDESYCKGKIRPKPLGKRSGKPMYYL